MNIAVDFMRPRLVLCGQNNQFRILQSMMTKKKSEEGDQIKKMRIMIKKIWRNNVNIVKEVEAMKKKEIVSEG